MSNSVGVSGNAKDAYPTKVLVESELLICFCYFVSMILDSFCSLLCMSVFHVWSFSLDYILLITTITLVPLITLSDSYSRRSTVMPRNMYLLLVTHPTLLLLKKKGHLSRFELFRKKLFIETAAD